MPDRHMLHSYVITQVETLSMDFTPVIDHLKEYAVLYALGVACVVPLVYFTRRWSLPIIFYTTEVVLYLALMHAAVGVLTRAAAWFKDQSSMKRAFDIQVKGPDWSTPWLQFWNVDLYSPYELIYVEIVAALIIIFLVWRLRPLRVKRRQAPPSKKADQYLRSRQAPMPGRGGQR